MLCPKNWWRDFVGQGAAMRHWSIVILLAGTGKVDRSCTEVQSHAVLARSALAPWMKSADGQAASGVLSVVELRALVGQSDTQGEQLHSGLVAPWIAEFEGVHRARHSHRPAAMLHRHEQGLLLSSCPSGVVSCCWCSASRSASCCTNSLRDFSCRVSRPAELQCSSPLIHAVYRCIYHSYLRCTTGNCSWAATFPSLHKRPTRQPIYKCTALCIWLYFMYTYQNTKWHFLTQERST